MEIDEYFHIYFHSFTIYVWDKKDIECEISFRIKHFHEEPGWRNWQTQRTQNPPVLGTLGVRLPLPAPCFDRLLLHQRARPAGIPFNFSNRMASGSLVSPEFGEPS